MRMKIASPDDMVQGEDILISRANREIGTAVGGSVWIGRKSGTQCAFVFYASVNNYVIALQDCATTYWTYCQFISEFIYFKYAPT
jgi:hypothetical protein